MKKLIFILLLLPFVSFGQITLIAHGAGQTNANTAVTGTITTTGANLIVVCVGTENNSVTVTDTKLNTYTLIRSDLTSGPDYCKMYYCLSPTTGADVVTATSTGGYPVISVSCWSGIRTSSPVDQQNGFGNTSVTSIQPGSITPSTNGMLIITDVINDYSTTFLTSSPNLGFTTTDYLNLSGSAVGGGQAYLIQSTSSAVNPTWSGTSAGTLISQIVSFKPAVIPVGTNSNFFFFFNND